MYYQHKRRTVGSKKPFQQNPLSYCQWDRTVAVIHSAPEPCISLFLPPFRRETSFSYAQMYYPWVLVVVFFNPYYNLWWLRALLIRNILLTFQSGQKVAKTILFSPLVLFLCHGWYCVLEFYGYCCSGKTTMVKILAQKCCMGAK